MTERPTNLYATDGRCHNSESGWYGQECGKPAVWLGIQPCGFGCGFCTNCKERGRERHGFPRWEPIEQPPQNPG